MSESSKTGFWLTVGGAVAGSIASAALGWLTPAWVWVAGVAAAVWRHLGGASALPNWGVYVLLLIAAQSLIHWALRFKANSKDNFRRYTKDNFFGAEWRWYFTSGHPAGLWAYCQSCSTALVYAIDGGLFSGDQTVSLYCEHCGTKPTSMPGDKSDMLGRVTRQIARKIETGEWRAVVDAAAARAAG